MRQLTYDPDTDSVQSPIGFYAILERSGKHIRLFGSHMLVTDRDVPSNMDAISFDAYVSHEHCLYVPVSRRNPYNVEESHFQLVHKPLHEWFWTTSQQLVNAMPSTPERAENNDKFQKSLETRKLNSLAQANVSTLNKIQESLTQSQMSDYTNVKALVLEQVHSGRLKNLTDLDIERLVLMKMIETQGLIDMVQNSGGELTRETLGYWDLARKMGVDAQKVVADNQHQQSSAKSVFSELESLAKGGYKVTLESKESNDIIDVEPIDVVYTELDEELMLEDLEMDDEELEDLDNKEDN